MRRALFLMTLAATLGGAESRRPNILVIISDDQGYADVGFNGGKGVHFSAEGLKSHAHAWAEKLIPWIESQR